jgi:hypothetical protein
MMGINLIRYNTYEKMTHTENERKTPPNKISIAVIPFDLAFFVQIDEKD